jgi:hypothetical protein
MWTLALAPLVLSGCIEDRLSVDMATRVLADGSCQRRIEYRLERVDNDKNGQRVPIPPAESPLRVLHRFPQGEGWTVRDTFDGDVHTVLVEGTLPSPNDVEGDYSRMAVAQGRPARNHVSFAMDKDSFDYSETIVDPASPLAGARLLSQALLKKQDEFSELLERGVDDPQVRRGELKRLFHSTFALPFSRDVAELVARPVFGPRERRAAEGLLDTLDRRQGDLLSGLQGLLPGRDRDDLNTVIDDSLEAWAKNMEKDLTAAGLPMPFSDHGAKVRFKATLTLPGPIVRANTCFAGDTATWEFEGEDLYGRGFEMWARAVSR